MLATLVGVAQGATSASPRGWQDRVPHHPGPVPSTSQEPGRWKAARSSPRHLPGDGDRPKSGRNGGQDHAQ